MQPNLKYRHALVYQLHILGKRITSLVGVIWIVYQACIMNPACQGWLILLFKVRESGLSVESMSGNDLGGQGVHTYYNFLIQMQMPQLSQMQVSFGWN